MVRAVFYRDAFVCRWYGSSTLLVLGLVLVVGCGVAAGDDDEAAHPADLDGDGHVSPDEFVEFAAKQESGEGDGDKLDANGDGHVSTEEFVAFAEKQAVSEGDTGPVTLTADNFDAQTKGSKAAFVQFKAPWCGHCTAMEDTFRQLAETVHSKHPGSVRIGTVDCEEQREFCEMFQIEGFPTLLLMKDPEVYNDATPVLFQGERDYEGMLEFLHQEGVVPAAA